MGTEMLDQRIGSMHAGSRNSSQPVDDSNYDDIRRMKKMPKDTGFTEIKNGHHFVS